MKLYLECGMGAAGDMLMSALYELLPDKQAFRTKMERLGLEGITLEYKPVTKCGITGTKIAVTVDGAEEISEDVPQSKHGDISTQTDDTPVSKKGTKRKKTKNAPHSHNHGHIHSKTHDHNHNHDHGHDHSHTHGQDHDHKHDHNHTHGQDHDHKHDHSHAHSQHRYSYGEITGLIKSLELPDNVLENALDVYKILGQAEASVHGVPLDEIHFHEVGSLDAIVDIVGCSILVEMLGIDEIMASPVHVGHGSVRCEHGILPVPAPAAAEILKGIPIYGGSIEGELCTPTGAALLKKFVSSFCGRPPMIVKEIGYGMGYKDFEAANCIRAFLFEEDTSAQGGEREAVFEISCNLDDMSPEALGAAFEILFEKGALDVYTTPIMMKKNRQAVMLTCLCKKEDRDRLARTILEHTTTLGVRITEHRRDIMTRTTETISTEYGEIRMKVARGFGITKEKPEYEDVLKAAKQSGAAYQTVYDAAIRASSK